MAYRITAAPKRERVYDAILSLAINGRVRASSRKIAMIAGCSHWTAQQALIDLQSRGAFTVRHAAGFGQRWRLPEILLPNE